MILYHNNEQKTVADQAVREIEATGIWDAPIVTQVVPFDAFYVAESYHQEYFKQNPDQAYCQVVIAPKVAKFRRHYLGKLKTPA
jgi:peptide-methionine (S)-S-oxide reductase